MKAFERWRGVVLMTAFIGALTAAGCTKRPATTTPWVSPPPVAVPPADAKPTTTLSESGPMVTGAVGPGTTGPGPRAQPDGYRDLEPLSPRPRPVLGRPPVKDFGPVSDLVDVHFEFDRYEIGSAQSKVLQSNARWLRGNQDLVLIEGHCDDRGTSEYNLALGERRAASAMNYLVSQGVAASRITIISYGKERPQCTDRDESCWRKNRRAHFLVKRQ